MTDVPNFLTQYQNHEKATSEANVINRATVFEALAAAGITTITVSFDGEGDSGQIEEIPAYANGEPCPLPDIGIEVQYVSWGSGKVDSLRTSLRDAIETLCYELLSQEHGGWENNDGAFGDFTFDVAGRQIDLAFNARYSDFTTSSHTF